MMDSKSLGRVLGKRSRDEAIRKLAVSHRPPPEIDGNVDPFVQGNRNEESTVCNLLSELDAVGVVELLDQDSRPTFVLDLDPDFPCVATGRLTPIFCNMSLQSYDRLSDLITGSETVDVHVPEGSTSYEEFRTWVTSVTKFDDSMDIYPLTFMYAGMLWTGSTIRKRWRIISGTKSDIFAGIPTAEISEGGLDSSSSSRRDSNSPPRLDPGSRPNHGTYPAPSEPSSLGRVRTEDRDEDTTASASIPNQTTTYGADESSWSSTGQSSTPSVILASPADIVTDWTAPDAKINPASHIAFARKINWAQTSLGALETWTPAFRQITNLLMGSPQPVAIFWGEELTMLYNAPYRDQIAGRKHPDLMGTGFKGPFKELWSTVGEIFAECARTGRAVHMINQHLPIERHGFLEETYFSWSFTPLYGGGKKILGFYNSPFETTLQQINSRRMHILRHLGEKLALAKSIKQFWGLVIQGLSDPGFAVDVPFLILYSVIDDLDNAELASTSSTGSSISMKSCMFEGALGVPEGHAAVPSRLDLKRSREGFIPAFREAMRTRQPTKLETRTGTLSEALLENIQWRGFEEPCKEAVVYPIRPTTGDGVLGFLLIGVNPRRPYDSEYVSFVDMLNRQLATSLASTMLFEEEIRKGRTAAEAAATEKHALSEQLALQTRRLQRMTEVAPVGMFYIDSEGHLVEANDTWYTITGHARNFSKSMSWLDVFAEESQATLHEGWDLLLSGESWQGELRLKHDALDPISNELSARWVLAMAHPETTAEGSVRSIMGSITDISAQKRASEHALARAILSEELSKLTQEAAESQKNFKNFSDLAPGGLIILDPNGHIVYANDQWYRISGMAIPPGSETLPWSNVVHHDSMPLFVTKWEEMERNLTTITVELRMKKPWTAFDGQRETWILASAYPDVQDGQLSSIMACITDISEIKWAEGLQKRRLEEADESRRQQNNFIDITSHEMRNPLSAILQSADEISQSLKGFLASQSKEISPVLVNSCIEAADIIALCGHHQKSIVDDILTVSKLDSNLLLITPVETQPVAVVQSAINMFEVELTKNKMTMHLDVHQSYKDLNIDCMLLDPSRLLQVLINLITNAIKFTQNETERRVVVAISASRQPPLETSEGFDYIAAKNPHLQMAFDESWGLGEILYLRFEVNDTGRGLNNDEKKLLFQRFSQASPRTHVQYGGSGLGLFISRQITELHGGKIGVASEAGVGSTFAFYIKARRSTTSSTIPKQIGNSEGQPLPDVHTQPDRMAGPVTKPRLRESYSTPAPASHKNNTVNPADLHILVVEDNLVNQKVLRKQLEKLGSAVAVANHGQEALDYLEQTEVWQGNEATGNRLSLILMDLEMPVMDGLTCVRCIRDLEEKGRIVTHVPIIAVTANARAEQIAMAMGSGMDGVVSKPFRVAQLITKIESLLLSSIEEP